MTFNFFANSPETGLLDFLRTIAFCYRARFRLSHCLHRAGMDYIRILPDTPLYETALRKQVLDETVSLLPWTPEDFGRLFYHEPGSRLQDLLFKLVSGLQGRGYARK